MCNHVLKIHYGAFARTMERVVMGTNCIHIEVDR